MKPTFRLFYKKEIDGSVLLFVSWTGPDIRKQVEAVLQGIASLNKTVNGWEVSVNRGGKEARKEAELLIQKALMPTHVQEIRGVKGEWGKVPHHRGRAFAPGQIVEATEASVAKADTATDSTTQPTQPDKPTS
jgi:hypothetical protein